MKPESFMKVLHVVINKMLLFSPLSIYNMGTRVTRSLLATGRGMEETYQENVTDVTQEMTSSNYMVVATLWYLGKNSMLKRTINKMQE